MKMIKLTLIITLFFLSKVNCIQLFSLTSKCISDFRAASIAAHNSYRALHSTPYMKCNATIDIIAAKYARYLAYNNFFNHSEVSDLGENLSYIWSSGTPNLKICAVYANRFVKMWYDEIKNYNYLKPGFSAKNGHFTQVIWKSSTQLGCGLAITTDNKAYGVCNYYKAGNVINAGFYQANVLPLVKTNARLGR